MRSTCCNRASADEWFDRALRLRRRGRKAEAVRWLRRAAAANHPLAQHNLGYCLEVGDGVKRNRAEALRWYKRAWRSGRQTITCCSIAQLFRDRGDGRRATYWWSKATDLGDGDAMLEMAKYLTVTRPRGWEGRVLGLLGRASCAESARTITPSGLDEVKRMLDRHLNRQD